MITRADVRAATERVAGHVRRTPVVQLGPTSWLTCEFLWHTGWFKARGGITTPAATSRATSAQPAHQATSRLVPAIAAPNRGAPANRACMST